MCGIWTLIDLINNQLSAMNGNHLVDFWNLQKRGPDNSCFETFPGANVGFHRLAIMDTSFKSNQPFILQEKDKTIVFICNGEIYNFRYLIEKFELDIENNSDCLTIPKLYLKFYHNTNKFFSLFEKEIIGEFAFVMLEFDNLKSIRKILVGRDQIGIRPLYYHHPNKNSKQLIFSSEVKGTLNFKDEVDEFEPGTIMVIKPELINFSDSLQESVYRFDWVYNEKPTNQWLTLQETVRNTNDLNEIEIKILENIRTSVIESIRCRLEADRPKAFLLSGGIDSSIVCAVATKLLGYPIKTFCCGMEGAEDFKHAKKVAEYIGSHHTEVLFTEEEALDSIEDVIYTIESWDTTTIRASVGQYMVCKYISKNTDAKVLLVGEGPDEVCSSYLFNWYAPDSDSIMESSKDYVKNIHYFDVKRSDRCISRWGLEGRVPLLDPRFISEYWKIPGRMRHPKFSNIEKYWLRRAFQDILPIDIVYRKKEAFSDGISSKEKSWFSVIQEKCDRVISDEEFKTQMIKNKQIYAPTKEAFYYMKVFIDKFGTKNLNIIPNYWLPKWDKEGVEVTKYIDPSARTLEVY